MRGCLWSGRRICQQNGLNEANSTVTTFYTDVAEPYFLENILTQDGDGKVTTEPVAGAGITLLSLTSSGSGCPQDTVTGGKISDTEFSLTFFAFGTQGQTDSSASCQITFALDVQAGYTLVVVNTDALGFADMPAGLTGYLSQLISVAGEPVPSSAPTSLQVQAGFSNVFETHAANSFAVYRQTCSAHVIDLNVNIQLRIEGTSNFPGQMRVDAYAGSFGSGFGSGPVFKLMPCVP